MLIITEHKPVEFAREHVVFSSGLTAWFPCYLWHQSCMFCLLYVLHKVGLVIASLSALLPWLVTYLPCLLLACLSDFPHAATKLVSRGHIIIPCLSSKHRAAFMTLLILLKNPAVFQNEKTGTTVVTSTMVRNWMQSRFTGFWGSFSNFQYF